MASCEKSRNPGEAAVSPAGQRTAFDRQYHANYPTRIKHAPRYIDTHGHTLSHTATRRTCRSHPMRRESIPRRHDDGAHPNSNPFMTRLIPFLLPCILTLAHPAMADASSEDMPAANVRPLNLSLPREMLSQPSTNGVSDETMLRNLQAPARTGNGPEAGSRSSSLPYGAGYEHRQRNTRSPGSGAGTVGSGHGTGRRGR